MKTDFYTKTMLTIIAICLTCSLLKEFQLITPAIANEKTINNSGIYSMLPLNENGSLDVNIKSTTSTMDVNIVDISTSDELDVNIDEIGGGYVSYGGPISVKVK